jgi:hypothetical protein
MCDDISLGLALNLAMSKLLPHGSSSAIARLIPMYVWHSHFRSSAVGMYLNEVNVTHGA